MIRSSRRRVRVATLLTALTLLATPVVAAGSAQAGSWSHRDAKGDVVRGSAAGDGAVEDPSDQATDITRLKVNHGPGKVTVTLVVRDLKGGDHAVVGRLVTPEGDYSVTYLRSADLKMFTLTDDAAGADTPDVPCRGKRISFDASGDRIRITVPRTCLGSPKWVRVGAGLVRGDLMSMADADTVTMDEALRRGSVKAFNSDAPLKVGKKVRAG
ncbi:hypothetical protein [Nocardioides sp. W7]|uniref:hypothetical protein n=1 Tax=Nocardioides sp. W7 TaxID=2931390 RepID=UPI001FD481C7|nr:hypothetical protein [Nocardioides sp. W7]